MEDEIRTLLHESAPKPSDPMAFRLELNAQLDAVEQIKQYRDGEYRQSRLTLCIVLAAGFLLGAMVTALVILFPFDVSGLTGIIDLLSGFEKSRYYTYLLIVAGAVMAAGAIVLPLILFRRNSVRFPDI